MEATQLIMNATTKVQAVEFLDRVEQLGSELAASAPKTTSEDLNACIAACRSLGNFAWALKTFPVFDPSCLTQRHMKECTVRVNGQDGVKVKLNVPVFARNGWNPNGTTQQLLESLYQQPAEIRQMVEKALQQSNPHIELKASCPKPPKSVRERVNAVQHRFDQVDLIWEAEWSIERVKDPLVVGIIGRTEFLIDEYDASKLERYIASEFTRSTPK